MTHKITEDGITELARSIVAALPESAVRESLIAMYDAVLRANAKMQQISTNQLAFCNKLSDLKTQRIREDYTTQSLRTLNKEEIATILLKP